MRMNGLPYTRHHVWFLLTIHVSSRNFGLLRQIFGFAKIVFGLLIIQVRVNNFKNGGSSTSPGFILTQVQKHYGMSMGVIDGCPYDSVVVSIPCCKYRQY